MSFIFILSSFPGADIPEIPIPFYHKIVHFIEYSILAGLGARAFIFGKPGIKFLKPAVLAWILTALFALSDEWHQTFVPGRSGCLGDAYFDMISAVIGIVFYFTGFYLWTKILPCGQTQDSRSSRGDQGAHA